MCSFITNSRVVLWEVKAQANDSKAHGPCAAAQPGTHGLAPSLGCSRPKLPAMAASELGTDKARARTLPLLNHFSG